MDLNFDVTSESGYVLVELAGEIDMHTAPRLQEKLVALMDGGDDRLMLDMARVDFLDSTGLGVLVNAFKAARDRGGWLRVVADEERVLKMFRITGLDQVFDIYPTQEQAAAAE